ncbi:hypothetical protein [Streptomyces carpinensis]|uniref:Uncharacterized protein n=1 Tax=Streptomyces carpinensis TaxID=66369 RepID=A0ABV1VWC4_9ACTN|nr:hypothetical protein [Streptomyces carpinensis]
MTTAPDRLRSRPEASSILPPPPPGVVPYIAGYSREQIITPRLTHGPGPAVGFVDETPHDRDSFGVPWVRPSLLPKARRGEPRFKEVHPFRQRRAMLDQLCQVCARPAVSDLDAPRLYVMHGIGRPVEEGELTASPPVCLPCAAIAVQVCPYLRRHHVAAWVRSTPAWGVIGHVHDPQTLRAFAQDQQVEYGSPAAAWVVAARLVSMLYEVTPMDLEAEFARLGRDRLEEEFSRVAELMAAA